MSYSPSSALPPIPGRLALPGSVQGLAALAVVAGGGALAWAFNHDASLAWSAYLIGMFFALGLGAMLIAAASRDVRAWYGDVLRRDIHRHPELGFEEHRTVERVTAELFDGAGLSAGFAS